MNVFLVLTVYCWSAAAIKMRISVQANEEDAESLHVFDQWPTVRDLIQTSNSPGLVVCSKEGFELQPNDSIASANYQLTSGNTVYLRSPFVTIKEISTNKTFTFTVCPKTNLIQLLARLNQGKSKVTIHKLPFNLTIPIPAAYIHPNPKNRKVIQVCKSSNVPLVIQYVDLKGTEKQLSIDIATPMTRVDMVRAKLSRSMPSHDQGLINIIPICTLSGNPCKDHVSRKEMVETEGMHYSRPSYVQVVCPNEMTWKLVAVCPKSTVNDVAELVSVLCGHHIQPILTNQQGNQFTDKSLQAIMESSPLKASKQAIIVTHPEKWEKFQNITLTRSIKTNSENGQTMMHKGQLMQLNYLGKLKSPWGPLIVPINLLSLSVMILFLLILLCFI